MFNALFTDAAGHTGADKSTEPTSRDNVGDHSSSTAVNPLLNLWSVATAVTSTVKARADELVKSVVDTDWRTELSQFSREVGEESKTLKEKTAELVEHLPEQVVHLPEKAEEALHHLPAQVHLAKDVGQTIEGVSVAFAQFGKSLLQGTKELIHELKDGVESEIATASREGKRAARGKTAGSSSAKLVAVTAKYNRFDAEVAAMQRDSGTYCDEPDDTEDYTRWLAGFSLESVNVDINRIMSDNAFMAELQSRLVPIIVEHDDFWHRYFYRLHKLQQKEEQRQLLAQRAKTPQEDEVPLGWGDDDEAQPSLDISDAQPHAVASDCVTSTPEPSAAVTASSAKVSTQAHQPASDAKDQILPVSMSAETSLDAPRVEGSKHVDGLPAVATTAAAIGASAAASPAPAAAVDSERSTLSGSGASIGGTGGNSGSTSVQVDAESSHVESEPHAETASDSSVKEWCVVSSSTQQAPHARISLAGPDAVPASASVPEQSESSETQSAEADVSTTHPVETSVASNDKVKGGSTVAVNTPTQLKVSKRPPTAGVDRSEEDLDEDWGNWD